MRSSLRNIVFPVCFVYMRISAQYQNNIFKWFHPSAKKADDKTADKITFNNTLVVLVVFRVEGDETQNLQKVFVFDFFLTP